MTALQPHGTRDVGHVKILAANFGEQNFPYKLLGALGERSAAERSGDRVSVAISGERCVSRNGKNQTNVAGPDRLVTREQDQSLDHVSQFADVSGPSIAAEFVDRVFGGGFFFPAGFALGLAGKGAEGG